MLTLLYILCWFAALWMTSLVIVKVIYKNKLDFQLVIMAAAWTSVITHCLGLWQRRLTNDKGIL